ncbi:hypothetical protein PHYSODRAFT_483821 [Phytophthora sojae]|uniref:Uncharacterized protein n=1 Tax=Phytophthora sojae (strain P6497) TaxID=1094619 RepID=G4YU52_PHYSP|nr:hypothetical protein PHYSODRAFT_483821 [Phytophthora sojae]EGZ23607.1 hypothetical protein PHYSODRAFT_483821 [Phytophthora sojae]|eukprot:XP_009518895.1 hypothetical protein PHYSODRAFT_483821 [Phytophthora sojae]
MLGGIFHKRKKSQELRSPSLQDLKKFRDAYAKYADLRQVDPPPCFEKSVYKAIAGQKELHTVEFRQEDITDPQMIALAEALLEMPIVSSLDLRDNRITDDGAKALLEVLRLQIIAAKTPPTIDPRTKQPLYPPLPEYTRYVTNVNLKGNEVSASVLQELSHYMDVLRREDKRLEIRAALNRIDRNHDGSIDEEEFKGVLKLLTTSTPTKKEIRAFMQQHTLSTDSTQNAVNLENVLLAKCAVSPSRHSACPPWEALVQERHAILGAPRMAPTLMSTSLHAETHDPPASKASLVRPSLTSSDVGMTSDPFFHSNSTSDLSPLSSPSTQAPVAPIDMGNTVPKPPPAPVVNASVAPQQPQVVTKASESKSATLSQPEQPPVFSKPPPVPILSLASVLQHPVSRSPRSARSSVDDEGHRNPSLAGPNSIISVPSSPHDSDISDSMSVVSSAFGGSVSQRVLEDHESVSVSERKTRAASSLTPASTTLDSPRWQSEHFSAEDEEGMSNGAPGGVREEGDELSSGNVDDEARSVYCHRGPKSLVTSGSSKDEEEVEERVDSLMFDVMKDGKERFVMKLIHSEFRSGLPVKDFPAELPFRNVLALLLPENGLSDLTLFAECRFPFVIVLDLSKNKLSKLPDDGLTAFPRLEVLNLGNNQLKTITGLTKTLKLRALCVSHNAIRTVKNVEHLLQLEILQLAHNQIATVHALRILSLNKVLAHLNLDGNPLVQTDERQKRKNIVHVRNLLPALQSLGSIPCFGLHTKDKKKADGSANPGKSLFDSDLIPDYKKLWVSTACDTLHILQDATSLGSGQSQHDDDEWDTRDEDGGDDRPKRPLTREQQRQKDELRSRAIGFRSRGKAIPSPPKVKTSVYCFGPPQPPSLKKKGKKKAAPADPKVVREQQRRASELSAPKHAPVDKTLMHQEQKRKSRVDFHAAMTVGERLQLARDMTQRRPTATIGLSARSRSILAKADSRKRASTAASMTIQEEASGLEGNARPLSPRQASPIKDAMVFRVDPANTPRSPKGVLTFRVDPHPAGAGGQQGSPKCIGSKESGFLHDLAVSDFLNHAEEEFSTALTALNVLLSMSEKEHGDRKKLADYRASLDALDILNEHESQELFKKAHGHPEHELQAQCTEWFTKLGVVKKCMRQLLEKLEVHAPGSGVIRAYCRCLRGNELRGIITTMLEDEDLSEPQVAENIEDTTSNQNADENPWTDDTTEATGGVEEAAIVTEIEEEAREGPVEATTAQNEDYDWLANSTELDAETAEADSFEHEMATVSEDEADVAHQEQAEPPQDYNWSTAEATEPTIEEGAETSEEAQNDVDGEAYENEEAYENGVVEDNGDYSVDGEVAAEDTEDTDAQYELGGGVDADDEEAETFGDWEKGFDPNSNHYFWFNHSTGESSWTPPEGWPYEVDEPFSAENEDAAEGAEAGEEQQDQEYDEQGTEAQEYEEGGVEEQEYAEGAAEGEYYEEEAGQDYATEDQNYEVAADEGHTVEQTEEESPRRSEVSDFEFDDSDLPGF